jgi:cell division protease FtsH
MLDNIVRLLGGRSAEMLVLGDVSTGASNDIQRATAIAKDMVTKYGMSDALGPINFGNDSNEVFLGKSYSHPKDYSEEIASLIDAEIRRIIDAAYLHCQEILAKHMTALHNVAGALIDREKLDGAEFEKLFALEERAQNFDEILGDNPLKPPENEAEQEQEKSEKTDAAE